jgi:hypothetical protein
LDGFPRLALLKRGGPLEMQGLRMGLHGEHAVAVRAGCGVLAGAQRLAAGAQPFIDFVLAFTHRKIRG